MSDVPIRPQAREAVADAIVLLISDEASVERIADAAIQAFLAAEEIEEDCVTRGTVMRARRGTGPVDVRLCGPWRRVDA